MGERIIKAAGKKILIVEDEVIITMLIRKILGMHGFKIEGIVDNGKGAIKMVAEHKPDLILMDITIKGELDGIETAAHIMGEYSTPVVFLTGRSDKDTYERAMALHPAAYIVKPIVGPELIEVIEMALSGRELTLAPKVPHLQSKP